MAPLMLRRGLALQGLPTVDRGLVEDVKAFSESGSACTRTSESSGDPWEPSSVKSEVSSSPAGTADLPLRRRRGNLLKGRLHIDCGQVVDETAASNPFLQSRCQSISEKYDLIESLGQGTTGVVYRARRKTDSEQVALKVMRMHDEEMLSIAREEFDILRTLEHPNIIRVHDFFTYQAGAVLVLGYFAGTSLAEAVEAAPGRSFCESTSLRLFRALIETLEYLHRCGIIHRDVKAQNVLVSSDLSELRLIDFNTARRVAQGALTMTGTIDYLPPEVLLGESLTEGSDIWAAGLCLHLMLVGVLPMERRLFPSNSAFGRAVRKQGRALLIGEKLSHISGPTMAILQACLTVDPDVRPGASELLAQESKLA